jgi:hypothetical protein
MALSRTLRHVVGGEVLETDVWIGRPAEWAGAAARRDVDWQGLVHRGLAVAVRPVTAEPGRRAVPMTIRDHPADAGRARIFYLLPGCMVAVDVFIAEEDPPRWLLGDARAWHRLDWCGRVVRIRLLVRLDHHARRLGGDESPASRPRPRLGPWRRALPCAGLQLRKDNDALNLELDVDG